MRTRLFAAALVALAVCWWQSQRVDAHITVVSQYTFNRDVRPILQRRCEQCHANGGIAPMSLVTFEEARAQSVAIRHSLSSGRMPGWSALSNVMPLQEQQSLTARELDILLTWAAGGTPEGAAMQTAPSSIPAPPPADVVIQMPKPFVFQPGVDESTEEVALPSSTLAGKWIRSVDVRPGAKSIVRRAEVVMRSRGNDRVIGLWQPSDAPLGLAGNGAFVFSEGSELVLRLHYKRSRPTDGSEIQDRSSVAIYLAPIAAAVSELSIAAGRQTIAHRVRVVGIRPIAAPDDAIITITITPPDGGRSTTLLRFTHRRDWERRYQFVAPVDVEEGSQIDVSIDGSVENIFRGALETIE